MKNEEMAVGKKRAQPPLSTSIVQEELQEVHPEDEKNIKWDQHERAGFRLL
jgi:hypothetical protein